MRTRPTDLAQYELLHGQSEYPYDFKDAPCTELVVDVFADRPVSIFLHVRKGSVDKWVPLISGQRRIELRGRFANCVGLAIHGPKESTINALVLGHPVGLDPIDYTPAVMHTDVPSLSETDKLRREFRALLDARLPERKPKHVEVDPELMGDEIPSAAGPGFEIDDDDPLDPADGVLLQDEPSRDPIPDDHRAGPDLDRGSQRTRSRERRDELASSDLEPADPAPDPEPVPTAPAGRS